MFYFSVQDQFEQHLRSNVKLNIYLYYGSERNRSKTFLSSQDVVITTYNVLSTDFGVSWGGSMWSVENHKIHKERKKIIIKEL